MLLLKVWLNIALSCNHQSIYMPQLQPLCSAVLYYPKGMKAQTQVNSVQWIEPPYLHLSDLNQGSPGPQSRVVTTILLLHSAHSTKSSNSGTCILHNLIGNDVATWPPTVTTATGILMNTVCVVVVVVYCVVGHRS